MKKRRAKDVFESADRTREHAYVIFPGEEMIEVTLEGSNTEKEAKFDFSKIRKLHDERKRTYVTAHEHPMKTEEHTGYLTVPSIADVRGFLLRGPEKVRTEFNLVCIAHNLQKIWRLTAAKGC